MNMQDLTVETLHAVVDYLITDSAEDICGLCALASQNGSFAADGIEPCVWRRKNGNIACRNGIIDCFQTKILNEEKARLKK